MLSMLLKWIEPNQTVTLQILFYEFHEGNNNQVWGNVYGKEKTAHG